jgi:hypothetical protein
MVRALFPRLTAKINGHLGNLIDMSFQLLIIERPRLPLSILGPIAKACPFKFAAGDRTAQGHFGVTDGDDLPIPASFTALDAYLLPGVKGVWFEQCHFMGCHDHLLFASPQCCMKKMEKTSVC